MFCVFLFGCTVAALRSVSEEEIAPLLTADVTDDSEFYDYVKGLVIKMKEQSRFGEVNRDVSYTNEYLDAREQLIAAGRECIATRKKVTPPQKGRWWESKDGVLRSWLEDGDPLAQVYDQGHIDCCWAYASASAMMEWMRQWFDDLTWRELFPFPFLSTDRGVHHILLKFAAADGVEGGTFPLFVFRVGPILGALLAIFGGPIHLEIAADWIKGGMLKQLRFSFGEKDNFRNRWLRWGDDMPSRIEAMRKTVNFPYILSIFRKDDYGSNANHGVILVKEKPSGCLGSTRYQALNSHGERMGSYYESQRHEDDDKGFFTVNFADASVKDYNVFTLAPPGSDIDVANLHQIFAASPKRCGSESLPPLFEFAMENPDIFPDGIETTSAQGNTLLMTSIIIGDPVMVDYLLNAGAAMNRFNVNLETPLDLAEQKFRETKSDDAEEILSMVQRKPIVRSQFWKSLKVFVFYRRIPVCLFLITLVLFFAQVFILLAE